MKRLVFVLLFGALAVVYAQRPALPVALFTPEAVQANTPANNPGTDAKAKLGQMLFDDKRLSVDDSVSCNTCHLPDSGFTVQIEKAKGVRDQLGARNAPTLLNVMFSKTEFWDGRAATLEDQATQPILNPVEMGQPNKEVVLAKLSKIPEFVTAFKQVFGHPVNWKDMGLAISAFERTLVSTEAPIDRFFKGQRDALTTSQLRGWELFNAKANCMACHFMEETLPLLGDSDFRNTGVAARQPNFAQMASKATEAVINRNKVELNRMAPGSDYAELGRFLVTKNPADIGAYKTPFLRDVVLTAPYMHDGSLATLWDVLDHYNRGGQPNQNLHKMVRPLNLTEGEISDLVDLLNAFTSDRYAAQAAVEVQRQKREATRSLREK